MRVEERLAAELAAWPILLDLDRVRHEAAKLGVGITADCRVCEVGWAGVAAEGRPGMLVPVCTAHLALRPLGLWGRGLPTHEDEAGGY